MIRSKKSCREKFLTRVYSTKSSKYFYEEIKRHFIRICSCTFGKMVNNKGTDKLEKNCCKKIWQKLKSQMKRKSFRGKRSILWVNCLEDHGNGFIPPLLSVKMEELERSVREGRWAYRAEGNANLVIALLQERVVLRFYKTCYGRRLSDDLLSHGEEKVKRDIKFCQIIMTIFLGKAYVQPPLLARIPDETVEKIDIKILPQRPVHRRHKGIRFGWVTISPDYAFLPPILSYQENYFRNHQKLPLNTTYCVEIKPKQGWINRSDRYHLKCTFCINQYLKIERKSVSRISLYCPLDLFSGDEIRMKKAIRGLLETPQNNLKIFEDGHLIYSDDYGDYLEVLNHWLEPYSSLEESKKKRLVDKWSSLVQEALIRELAEEPLPNRNKTEELYMNNSVENFHQSPLSNLFTPCDWSYCPLPSNSILNRILGMQKLQQSNFASVYELYTILQQEENDYDYLKRLSGNKWFNLIERYLLSATANDCSILITFQRTEKSQFETDPLHYIKDCDGVAYVMNIGVSDLDPKPLSCVGKHYKRNKDMVAACLNSIRTNTNLLSNKGDYLLRGGGLLPGKAV